MIESLIFPTTLSLFRAILCKKIAVFSCDCWTKGKTLSCRTTDHMSKWPQDIRNKAHWKKGHQNEPVVHSAMNEPQQVLPAVKRTILKALQILWKSRMLSDMVGSYMARCPSCWFWSLAMAYITNQFCSNCRFYHWIYYNQFLKIFELKTGSSTH